LAHVIHNVIRSWAWFAGGVIHGVRSGIAGEAVRFRNRIKRGSVGSACDGALGIDIGVDDHDV